MELRHLDTLLAVIDHGSFDGAAASLGISASAVSQRIKSLEGAAGRVLVRRTSPPVATEAGEILVQTARRQRLLVAEATAELSGRSATVPLPIVVNADSLGTWFPRIFKDANAQLSAGLRIAVEDERHSHEMLRRGDCVGAITTEAAPVPGCQSEYLGALTYVPVAAPTLAAGFREGTWGWADFPTVRFGAKDRMEKELLEAELGRYAPSSSRVETHIPAFDAFNQAVVAGMGWAMLPKVTARGLLDSGHVVLLSDFELEVGLYWQHWRIGSSVLEKLGDAIHAAAALELQ